LAATECHKVAAERIAEENKALVLKLDQVQRMHEFATVDKARAAAGEARASAQAGEVLSELRLQEGAAADLRQRVAGLEEELAVSRAHVERLTGEHSSSCEAMENLREELKVARDCHEEEKSARQQTVADLIESRRKLGRTPPQLAESRRRLNATEETLSRAQADAAEERRARERCHAEANRAGEKLRTTRAQNQHLRERVQTLEDIMLRYPSRHVDAFGMIEPSGRVEDSEKHTPSDAVASARVRALTGAAAGWLVDPSFSSEALATMPTSLPHSCNALPLEPRSLCCATDSQRSGSMASNFQAVHDFVAHEEQRLTRLDAGVSADSDACLGEERPRGVVPTQAQLGVADAGDDDLEAVLAAEPLVLTPAQNLGSAVAQKIQAVKPSGLCVAASRGGA
jgi:hypothetical protein